MDCTCIELALEGERLCKAGDCKTGVQFFEAAVNSGTDNFETLSAIFSQLGNAYFYLQEYGKALECYKQDLDLARTLGDRVGEAKACGNLGNTLKVLGKFDVAIACCHRHLDLSRELKDRIGEARALYNLGNVYNAKGKHNGRIENQDPGELEPDVKDCLKKAAEYYIANLNIVQELGDRAAQGRACGNLGNTHYLLGNFRMAIIFHQERLAIAQEFVDKPAIWRALTNLGNAHVFLGEFEVAAEHYRKTQQIAKQLSDKALEAQACYNLGNTYTLLKEKAIEYHMKHLKIAQELEDRVGEGWVCWSLGNTPTALGKNEEAIKFASKHLEISRERDQERKGVTPTTTPEIKTTSSTEKWMKPKQESLRRKAIRKNPLSLSHERDQERKGVTPTTTPEIKTTSSTEKWMKIKQESLRRKAIRKNPLSLSHERDQERKGVTPTTTPEIKTTSSTEKWMKIKQESLRRKAIRKNPLSLSHESLVVFDQEPVQQKLSSDNSVNSIVSHDAKTIEQEEVGRVAGWAVRFEKLLQDSIGIKVFTDFLKKEYSEENVEFWKVCEDYRNIIDSNFRKSKAKEIFDQYVSLRGSHSVNIDSNARKQAEIQLDNPTPQTFEVAQSQIFQLMKQDSFFRFPKSDLYKDYLMKEMEGKPLETGVTTETSGEKVKNDKHGEKESKKKGKENEEYKEKRRSLLPWRQNFIGNKKSNPKSSSEAETKTSKSKLKEEKEKEVDVNSNVPLPVASIPRVELPETIDEEPEQPRLTCTDHSLREMCNLHVSQPIRKHYYICEQPKHRAACTIVQSY